MTPGDRLDPRTLGDMVVYLRYVSDRIMLAQTVDEARQYAPGLMQASALLVAPPNPDPSIYATDECTRCGIPMVPASNGRPRKYCEDCSPRKTPKEK